jgi:PAS domain S-box-containing protein
VHTGPILLAAATLLAAALYAAGSARALRAARARIRSLESAQAAGAAGEDRYRSLFEHAHDVIYTTDLAGNFTSLNRAAEKAMGYSRAEALGMNSGDVMAPEARERAWMMVQEQLAGAPPGTAEIPILTRDGRTVHLEIASRLLFDNGRPVGSQVIGRDITERKLWQEQLAKSAEELRRKNAELSAALAAVREAAGVKSRFLANMSHEIRTPINGVLGMAEHLLSSPLEPDQRESAEAIRESAERLLTMIGNVLDISQIGAGKVEVRRAAFDLHVLVGEVATAFALEAESKGLALVSEVDGAVPRLVEGDPVCLRQVLSNLVANAVKFTERGGVRLRVESEEVREASARIRWSVADTGIGISPEDASDLFDSFTQADTSITRKYEGAGLGLAISKHLVEGMGGRIGFESEPGRGSTFWFTLELALPDLANENPGQALGLDVLVVEDNPVNRRVALHMLAHLGCRAEAVPDGKSAVEAVAAGGYALVLMDLHMPEMDGFAATAEIRRLEGRSRHTPVIALTARAIAGDRERCLEAGMDDYLSKPVRRDELHSVLQRWGVRPRANSPAEDETAR